jgi:hypothetical protein
MTLPRVHAVQVVHAVHVLTLLLACSPPPAAAAPTRTDHGALIVLDVAGSYEEMGRQQAELLGDDLRQVFAAQRRDHDRAVERGGFGAGLLDTLGVPLWSGIGGAFEDSSFHDELAGLADGLGVPRRELMRALLSLGGGSTVFAATRSATADGKALIGRNVDWDDDLGKRRPVVVHYRPDNGDLEHLAAGWPLVGLPTVGVNAAGFALSFNYFETDPQVGMLLPQWPHRRALQKAHTVQEGIDIFLDARLRGISSFMVMADAQGDIAMVECTPSDCAVFRPDGDWFGQANHARTPEMIPFDLYRSPDSFDRRRAVESATARFVGELTPMNAVEVLRDRSLHPWPNASNVGNLAVLNAAVVHPASRTLWHARSLQPVAPFGAYVGLSLGSAAPEPATIPASEWFGSAAMTREVAVVGQARRGLHDLREDRFASAFERFESVLGQNPPVLDPARIALAAGYAAFRAGEPKTAERRLAASVADDAPIDVRIYGLSLQALCADALGRRSDAAELHRRALTLIEANPQWNEFDRVAELAREGIRGAVTDREPVVSVYALRVPF